MKVIVEKETGIILSILTTNQVVTNVNPTLLQLDVENPYESDGVTLRVLAQNELPDLAALEGINNTYISQMSVMKDKYTSEEQSTWFIQAHEAYAWKLDRNISTPFIDGILTVRTKYTKAELIDLIINKYEKYVQKLGIITGTRQHNEDLLNL